MNPKKAHHSIMGKMIDTLLDNSMSASISDLLDRTNRELWDTISGMNELERYKERFDNEIDLALDLYLGQIPHIPIEELDRRRHVEVKIDYYHPDDKRFVCNVVLDIRCGSDLRQISTVSIHDGQYPMQIHEQIDEFPLDFMSTRFERALRSMDKWLGIKGHGKAREYKTISTFQPLEEALDAKLKEAANNIRRLQNEYLDLMAKKE